MEPVKHTQNNKPDLVHDAKDVAGKVVDPAKDFVGDQVTEKQDMAADQIGQIAEALHRSSDELNDSFAGPYVKKAADALEHISHSVRTASFGTIVEKTENFARRDPLLFIGGAFTLGLLAARFLKSSSGESQSQSSMSTTSTTSSMESRTSLAISDGRTTQPMNAQTDMRRRSPRGTGAPSTRGSDGNG